MMLVSWLGTFSSPPVISTRPVQDMDSAMLNSPETRNSPPRRRTVPSEWPNCDPGDSPTNNWLTCINPPLMVRLALLVRPMRVMTVTLVVSGSSRATSKPLSRVTSPIQTLKDRNRPVTNKDELVSTRCAPRYMLKVALETTSGLLVPASCRNRVLVAPAGAEKVKLLMNRLVSGTAPSNVMVLLPAFVMNVEPEPR